MDRLPFCFIIYIQQINFRLFYRNYSNKSNHSCPSAFPFAFRSNSHSNFTNPSSQIDSKKWIDFQFMNQ